MGWARRFWEMAKFNVSLLVLATLLFFKYGFVILLDRSPFL